MKKKKDTFYYDNLNECVEYSYEAACFLEKILKDYNPHTIQEAIAQIHEIEQKADTNRHKMMAVLNKAFITPIEREDLVSLSNILDDITDAIEEVLLQIYITNVKQMREDVLTTVQLLLECIACLCKVLHEFSDFKTSETIKADIVRVNDFEEQGDHLYINSMHRLYEEDNLKDIAVWRNIYECIEMCFDICENTADIVQTVIMKNT